MRKHVILLFFAAASVCLAKTLNGCREVQDAAAAGIRACVAALLSKDLELSGRHVKTALERAATITVKAEDCN